MTSNAAGTPLVFVLIDPAPAVTPASDVTVTDVTCSPDSSQGLINCVGGGERSMPKSRVADGSLKNVGVTGGKRVSRILCKRVFVYPCAIRSSNWMAKRFRAAFQSLIGIDHFLLMLFSAR